jgi:hypothetical protein
MTESIALSTTTKQQGNSLAFLHDGEAFNHLWRVAKAFSLSGMVPEAYQGKPEACLVALMYAQQLGEHPMLLFQEMGVYKGKPITSTKFAIARANNSGILRGPITWQSQGTGPALEVIASAVLRETGEVITAKASMKEAIADGWTRNAKYQSIPEQMLRWRSASRLINLYFPEVLFGMGVREEAEVQKVQVAETPASSGDTIADLNRQIAAQAAAPAPAVAPAVVDAEEVTEPEAQPLRRRAAAVAPAAPQDGDGSTSQPEPVAETQDDGFDLPESPFGEEE